MTPSGFVFILSIAVALVFLWRYVLPSFGLSSSLLGLMLLFHAPAYWYYTRQWALGKGELFNLYNKSGSTASSHEKVVPKLAEAGARFYQQISSAASSPAKVVPKLAEAGDSFYHQSSSAASSPAKVVPKLAEAGARFYHQSLSALLPNTPKDTLDIALALTFIAICLGIWLADCVFRNSRTDQKLAVSRWSTTPIQAANQVGSLSLRIVAVTSILFMLYFMVRDDQLFKIYEYFSTQAGEFKKIAMRREMGGSPVYFFNLILGNVLTFVAFYFWTWWREGMQPGAPRWLALGVILLVIVAKLATLSKAPATIFILQLLVLEMVRRSLRLSLRYTAILAGVSVLLFSLMTFVANSNLGGFSQSLIFLFYRVFMIPNESLLEYFIVIPHQLAHTFGHDIRLFADLLGVEPLRPTYWRVAEALRGVGGSTTTAMFMADAWAAFSWAGVILIPLTLGFLVRWIDIELIVKRGRNCATIAGLGLGHYGIFIALSTAFQTALWTGGLILILPLVIAFERLSANGSTRALRNMDSE